MLITGWSKGVDWVSFFHNVCQMQQVLQKQGEPRPGNLATWAPH